MTNPIQNESNPAFNFLKSSVKKDKFQKEYNTYLKILKTKNVVGDLTEKEFNIYVEIHNKFNFFKKPLQKIDTAILFDDKVTSTAIQNKSQFKQAMSYAILAGILLALPTMLSTTDGCSGFSNNSTTVVNKV